MPPIVLLVHQALGSYLRPWHYILLSKRMVSRIPKSQSRMFVSTKKQGRLALIGPKIRNWEFVKPCGELLKRYDSQGDGLDWIQLLLDIPKRLYARI